MTQFEFEELHETISVKMELITPEIATEYLTHNKNNRRMKDGAIRKYCADMENGRWIYNGDVIRFDTNGDLRDGQHRLTAIVRTGVAQPYVVIRGLAPETFKTMDTGVPRSFGDKLKEKGIENDNAIAAFVTKYFILKNGRTGTFTSGASQHCGSMSERIDYVLANNEKLQEIHNMVQRIRSKGTRSVTPAFVTSIAYYLTEDKKFPATYIEKFLYNILVGCDKKYEYINNTRNYWNSEDVTHKVTDEEKYYGFVHCFNNFFKANTTLKKKWSAKVQGKISFMDFSEVKANIDEL